MTSFTVRHAPGPLAPKLVLSGRFDSYALATVHAALRRVGESSVDLDLSAVDFLDEAAIGLLLRHSDELARRRRGLIVSEASHTVRVILDLVGADRLLDMTQRTSPAA